jgi:hypothetical protein
LSVVYSGTGYAVQADYSPGLLLERIGIRVTTATGKGLSLKDIWISRAENVEVLCDNAVTAASGSVGVQFGGTIFAGDFTAADWFVDGFYDNISIESMDFANLTFDGLVCQSWGRYGVFCDSGFRNLKFANTYIEGGTDNAFRIGKSGSVLRNFIIDTLFVVGGNKTDAGQWIGEIIQLDYVRTFRIENVHIFRPWTSFLNVGNQPSSGGTRGSIDQFEVHHDSAGSLPVGPLYMVKGVDTAVSNYFQTNSTRIELMDESSYKRTAMDRLGVVAAQFGRGPVEHQSLAASAYDMANASPIPNGVICTCTVGTCKVKLPDPSNRLYDSLEYWVFNDPASAQNLNIRDKADTTTIHTLTPGDFAYIVCDRSNAKWVIVPAAASYGP